MEGWNYAEVVRVLLENSKISPKNLGIGICNAYMDECRKNGYEDDATMALIDLERFGDFYDTIRTCGEGLFRMSLPLLLYMINCDDFGIRLLEK